MTTISFCTQIHNRAWQLRETIAQNLEVLAGTPHRWTILDVHSTDDLGEVLRPHLGHPNLRVIQAPGPYDLIAAKVRVCATADGDYLFSLDADGFVSRELLAHVVAFPNDGLHAWTGNYRDGTFGRIGAPTWAYKAVGGFPHFLRGAGVHDVALVSRLSALVPVRRAAALTRLPVFNEKHATVTYLNPEIDERGYEEIILANRRRYVERPLFAPRLTVKLPSGVSFPCRCQYFDLVDAQAPTTAILDVTPGTDFQPGRGGDLPRLQLPTGELALGWSPTGRLTVATPGAKFQLRCTLNPGRTTRVEVALSGQGSARVKVDGKTELTTRVEPGLPTELRFEVRGGAGSVTVSGADDELDALYGDFFTPQLSDHLLSPGSVIE